MKINNLRNNSIRSQMNHIEFNIYSRQTLVSIFKCLLETIIENRDDSTVLIKLNKSQDFQGILNRLKYSESKVYIYSDNISSESFTNVNAGNSLLENDEFLLVVADRFSACLYWNEATPENLGLNEGFCSLNPQDAVKVIDYIQSVAHSEKLETDLSAIRQDRRNNEKFTVILSKLVSSLENRQRDLMCANAELKEFHEKTLQSERLAAIGQFCSTIAHEIRNPLGMINTYARIISKNIENLQEDNIAKETKDSLNNAAKSINYASLNLEKLLTELIDYSKPIILDKTETDLRMVLTETINLIKPSFDEKNVEIAFNYNLSNKVVVKFDKYKITQAFLNVVKNALEVSKEADIVNIIVEQDESESMIHITLEDQGSGILPENRFKLFTPYFSTKKEGTGLGLVQSRKIMEAHNGNLTVRSTSPKGTTLDLSLPVTINQQV